MLVTFVIGYILVTLGIGFWYARKVKSSSDFVSAGRQLPLILNSFALFALWYGSETIFGASAVFMEEGLLGVIEDPFGAALCLILFSVVFARRLYRMNLFTLGDLFRNKYGRKVEVIASFFMIISFFGYVAAQLVALGLLIHSLMGIGLETSIIASAIIVGTYTVVGGMWAISVTDFLQSVVIILGLGWVTYTLVSEAGGLGLVIESAPAGFYRFIPEAEPLSWIEYFGAWSVIGLGSLASQDVFQRVNAAKSEKSAVLAGYLGGGIYLLFSMFPLIIILSIRKLYPELQVSDTQQSIPEVILLHSSLPVQIFLFGALISAIFSTCSGAILAPASLMAENVIKPLWGNKLSEKRFLIILRISVIVITLTGMMMALGSKNIYELVGESSILGLVSMLIPMTAAIFWQRANALGAISSMILGFIFWLFAEHIFSTSIPALFYGMVGGLIGLFAGNFGSKSINKKIEGEH